MGATMECGHDESSGYVAKVRAGMEEIERRWGQPYRGDLWKYILPVSSIYTAETCSVLLSLSVCSMELTVLASSLPSGCHQPY